MEGKAQLLFGTGTSRERVETLDELKERDISVIVAVEDGDDTPDERVVCQLGDLEKLRRLQGATLVPIDLAEVLVELLELLLVEVQILQLLLLLLQFVTHFHYFV